MTYLPPPLPARPKQSLAVTLSAGAGAALVGAVAWGLITYLTKHQYSVLAVVLGLAVGTIIARLRPGDMTAAVGSAVISLLGAVLGTVLAAVFFLVHEGIGLGTVLAHLGTVLSITLKSEDFLGYLFWALAAFIGFRIPMQIARRRKVVGTQPVTGPAAPMQGGTGSGFPSPTPQPFMPSGQHQPQPPGFGQPAFDPGTAAGPVFGQPGSGPPVFEPPAFEPPTP